MCIRIVRFHYTTKQKKCQDVDGFVSAIYLYDDRITLVFGFKDVTKTIIFAELEESGLGSDINALAAPEKSSPLGFFVRVKTKPFLLNLLLWRRCHEVTEEAIK